ncbi:unnamed protein product [Brassica oleracea]
MLWTDVREIRSKEIVFGYGTKGLVGERRGVGYGERCLNMEQMECFFQFFLLIRVLYLNSMRLCFRIIPF